MKYILTANTVNEINGREGLDKMLRAFLHNGWKTGDLEQLLEKGEIDIVDHVHDWGVAIKSTVKLEKILDDRQIDLPLNERGKVENGKKEKI